MWAKRRPRRDGGGGRSLAQCEAQLKTCEAALTARNKPLAKPLFGKKPYGKRLRPSGAGAGAGAGAAGATMEASDSEEEKRDYAQGCTTKRFDGKRGNSWRWMNHKDGNDESGDCFFTSFRLALQHDSSGKLDFAIPTVAELRAHVADAITQDTIDGYMASRAAGAQNTGWLAFTDAAGFAALPFAEKKALFGEQIQTKAYWADIFAIKAISVRYNVMILIVDQMTHDHFRCIHEFSNANTERPDRIIVMRNFRIRGGGAAHYEPLLHVRTNSAAWTHIDVPHAIRDKFQLNSILKAGFTAEARTVDEVLSSSDDEDGVEILSSDEEEEDEERKEAGARLRRKYSTAAAVTRRVRAAAAAARKVRKRRAAAAMATRRKRVTRSAARRSAAAAAAAAAAADDECSDDELQGQQCTTVRFDRCSAKWRWLNGADGIDESGDCFFTCIIEGLKRNAGQGDIDVPTVRRLRGIVADKLLASSDDVLNHYKIQASVVDDDGDREVEDSWLSFMRTPAFEAKTPAEQRQQLAAKMKTTNYFADQFALVTLEEALDMRFLIVDQRDSDKFLCIPSFSGMDVNPNPTRFIVMRNFFLGGVSPHYEPLMHVQAPQRACWTRATLPEVLKRKFKIT